MNDVICEVLARLAGAGYQVAAYQHDTRYIYFGPCLRVEFSPYTQPIPRNMGAVKRKLERAGLECLGYRPRGKTWRKTRRPLTLMVRLKP